MTTALAECTKNQQCEILLLCSEGVKNNYIYERVTVKYDDILQGKNVACKWWKGSEDGAGVMLTRQVWADTGCNTCCT